MIRKIRPILTLKSPLESVPPAFMRDIAPRLLMHGVFLPCWVWTGSLDPNGYPIYRWRDPVTKKNRYVWPRQQVARMFWEFPKGYYIHTTCGNMTCLNPGHFQILVKNPSTGAKRNG